jgi:outer membrane protein OmpA-like peptidoglycan-associated protein
MPVVPVPELTEAADGTKARTIVPDALLFPPDSAALSPEATGLLSSIADRIKTQLVHRPTDFITITGYTADSDGSTQEIRLRLSQMRAQAVADGLAKRGVTNTIVAQGGGVAPGMTAIVKGVFDGTAADQMRRVEISVEH